MRILIITNRWPTDEHPDHAPFIVQQVDFLRRGGADVDVFTFRGGMQPLRYAKAWIDIRRIHRHAEYDVVHVHYGQCGFVTLPSPVPLVVTYHGSELEGVIGLNGKPRAPSRMIRALVRAVARRADANVAVSGSLASLLPPESEPFVIPCGIDLELFVPIPTSEARAHLGMDPKRRYVLFGGSPEIPRERYALAQSAVALLGARHDVELVAVTGVPHRKMPLYMNACDVLVVTSVHESSPTMVKEALACDLPVVTLDVGDVKERLGALSGCVICPDDSANTIAEGLDRVLSSEVAFSGRARVHELDERRIVERLFEVYERVTSAG